MLPELRWTHPVRLRLRRQHVPAGHFPPGNNVVADAIVFSDNLSPKGKTVKTYLWNQDKKPLVVNKMSYYFTRKCKVLTGLYEPLN